MSQDSCGLKQIRRLLFRNIAGVMKPLKSSGAEPESCVDLYEKRRMVFNDFELFFNIMQLEFELSTTC